MYIYNVPLGMRDFLFSLMLKCCPRAIRRIISITCFLVVVRAPSVYAAAFMNSTCCFVKGSCLSSPLYLFYYKCKGYLNEDFFPLCGEHCSVFWRKRTCFGSCGARQVHDCSGGVGISDALPLPSLGEKEWRQ